MERRKAQMCCLALGIACEAMMFRKRIALRRSIAGFWARGPCFRVWTGERIIPDPDGFRRLHPHRVQPRTAEPRSWPGRGPQPPGRVFARHACRRRILLRLKAPSRSAPHEQDTANLSAVQSAGMRIPITKCCRKTSRDTLCRHSGARVFARARNPRSLRRFLQ